MSKRKTSGDPPKLLSLELDEEQVAALKLVPENLHPNLKCLIPVLESIREAYGSVVPPHRKALLTRQATDFKRTTAAAKALGIDYKEDDAAYIFSLQPPQPQDSGKLSDHFASVIKDLKNSDYVSVRHDESFCRTVLDLIIMDRLRHLEDKDAHHRLQVSAEVPVSIRIQDVYGNHELVKGRVDWALGYGTDKNDTGSILIVVEAKPYESAPVGMPQLLVYMAAVQEARRDRVNSSVFGMVSDSKEFRFCFLNPQKRLFTSEPLTWATKQSTIIAYIDMMLMNAIESSPHTAPRKKNNRTILNYSGFLERQWRFGEKSNDEWDGESDEDSDEEDDSMVDLVNIGGRVVMRGSTRPGRFI